MRKREKAEGEEKRGEGKCGRKINAVEEEKRVD